ncbi:MAG: YIP1 family protein [Bacteroidales bacterium]
MYLTLLLSPRRGWRKVKNNPLEVKRIILTFILPAILMATIFTFIATNYSQSDTNLAIRNASYFALKWLLSILLSGWAINKLIGAFKGKREIRHTFLLVAFPSAFLLLFSSIALFFPGINHLMAVGAAIGVIYFYIGVNTLVIIPKERVVGFFVTSLLLFFIITSFFEVVFAIIFELPIKI